MNGGGDVDDDDGDDALHCCYCSSSVYHGRVCGLWMVEVMMMRRRRKGKKRLYKSSALLFALHFLVSSVVRLKLKRKSDLYVALLLVAQRGKI